MFETAPILGSREERIVVETRKRTPLTNFIVPEPEFQHLQWYELLCKKYGTRWLPRKPATGGYNCAGHVWASRRAALPEESEWRIILNDDGYRPLADDEVVCPDDLVLYVEEPVNEILHVARIVGIREGQPAGSLRIPWAVSKWNATSGEVMHSVYDVPYTEQGFRFRREFWTDRPSQ